jgi:hypothetical protein
MTGQSEVGSVARHRMNGTLPRLSLVLFPNTSQKREIVALLLTHSPGDPSPAFSRPHIHNAAKTFDEYRQASEAPVRRSEQHRGLVRRSHSSLRKRISRRNGHSPLPGRPVEPIELQRAGRTGSICSTSRNRCLSRPRPVGASARPLVKAIRTASRLNSSLFLCPLIALLDDEISNQGPGRSPGQVHFLNYGRDQSCASWLH